MPFRLQRKCLPFPRKSLVHSAHRVRRKVLPPASSSGDESDFSQPLRDHQGTAAADLKSKLTYAVRERRANAVRDALQDAERLGIEISAIRDCTEKGNTLLHLVLAKKFAKTEKGR